MPLAETWTITPALFQAHEDMKAFLEQTVRD